MKIFQRKVENFKCDNCGYEVLGNGYTDHCPKCLYSKHVDIHPGDRQNDCQGLMKVIGFEIRHGNYILNYQCLKCGYIHNVKADKEDNLEMLVDFYHKII